MTAVATGLPTFDGPALIDALDTQRRIRTLRWPALADALHGQSAELNARLQDNAMCPGALVRTAKRGTMSCQYALTLLRWLGRAPEDFLVGPVADVGDTRLPAAGPGERLRWNLGELFAPVDAQRRARGLTWPVLGDEIGCTAARLTNLKTARLADMGLTMRVTQWIGAPAARFVHPAAW